VTIPPQPPSPAPGGRRSLADRMPNAYVLIFLLLIVTAALTWIVPAGQFARTQGPDGRTIVVPNSFRWIDPGAELPEGYTLQPAPQGVMEVLRAPMDGFVATAYIIVFILVLGGAFRVLEATGAIVAGIRRTTEAMRGREVLIIPVMMTLFSIGGATIGMSEETIIFVMMFVPLALALGYDTITGVCMVFVGAGAGFAAAFLNPFTVGIAQGIAELPPGSGMGYRVLVWVIVTAVAIAFVMRYAHRVKRDPSLSPTFALDEQRRTEAHREAAAAGEVVAGERFSASHAVILLLLAITIVLIGFGSQLWGWYVLEIAAVFFAFALVAGIIARLGGDEFVATFIRGAQELTGVALVVGLARAVLIVAEQGGIIDPALHALSAGIGSLPAVLSAQLMFIFQSMLNFIVPSGSGQAALTMPVMAPLADLVGVTRQTAVLAYQFGDGFTNLIIPTSPVLLGVLGAARVPWSVWARWMLPLQLIFLLLGLLLLIPPVLMNWGPH
jgi:uncharacterized ion transporter superfamily protein YfcC